MCTTETEPWAPRYNTIRQVGPPNRGYERVVMRARTWVVFSVTAVVCLGLSACGSSSDDAPASVPLTPTPVLQPSPTAIPSAVIQPDSVSSDPSTRYGGVLRLVNRGDPPAAFDSMPPAILVQLYSEKQRLASWVWEFHSGSLMGKNDPGRSTPALGGRAVDHTLPRPGPEHPCSQHGVLGDALRDVLDPRLRSAPLLRQSHVATG